MDNATLTRHMLTAAKRDMFNNKGRIIISDFLVELPEKIETDAIELLLIWRSIYPEHKITHPTQNVLLIELGKLSEFGRAISLESQQQLPKIEE